MSIRYSCGESKFDAYPAQLEAESFQGFAGAFLDEAARPTSKGKRYFAAPFKISEDARAHRCKADVLPCRFLAFDLDGMHDATAFSDLRQWAQRFNGFAYTTASHTADQPRARLIFEANRDLDREERIRVSQVIQERISLDLRAERFAFDQSVYRPEQPIYTPLAGADVYHFEGDVVDADHLLADAPAVAPDKPGTRESAETAADNDPVLAALRTRGLVLRMMSTGKFAVECPFAAEHTNFTSDSATVYYLPHFGGYKGGNFVCLHAHCEDRKQIEFLSALGLDHRQVRHTQAEGSIEFATSPNADDWPALKPLPPGIPPVAKFDLEMLPDALRPWVTDASERMQCPPDFAAVGVIVSLSSIVGRQVAIRPKRQDDWTVVLNLWGMIVGRPSVMKSPALDEAMRPLQRLVHQAQEQDRADQEAWKVAEVLGKALEKGRDKKISALINNGKEAEAEELIRETVKADAVEPPTERRYKTNDTTVEKLGELLAANPNGLLVFRDELRGFLQALEKEGRESERAFYLEAWKGSGDFTYDRIQRGTVHIKACCVSVLGGIQPGPLSAYVRAACSGSLQDDGLLQRFQLAVYPDLADWKHVDRCPDGDARNAAYETFQRLETIKPEEVGATVEEGELPYLRFSDAAQAVFTDWLTTLETRLRNSDLPTALESHLAKYRSLVPSLALLAHLADGKHGPVGEQELRRACDWAAYLESHAMRIYAPVSISDAVAAQALVKKIQRGAVSEKFTAREVYRCGWSGLTDKSVVTEALALLVELNWLAELREETGGKPKVWYAVNPRVQGATL